MDLRVMPPRPTVCASRSSSGSERSASGKSGLSDEEWVESASSPMSTRSSIASMTGTSERYESSRSSSMTSSRQAFGRSDSSRSGQDDDSDINSSFVAVPLQRTQFDSWEDFHSYLREYETQTYQVCIAFHLSIRHRCNVVILPLRSCRASVSAQITRLPVGTAKLRRRAVRLR